MPTKHFQNGCDYYCESHPFFGASKKFRICPQNVPYLSLSVEPMNFLFFEIKNVPYLSPLICNKLKSKMLQQAKNNSICLRKCSVSVPDESQMFPICPPNAKNVPYLSPKCSLSVPKILRICPQNPKCSVSVPDTPKKLRICPQNSPYLSPKCSLFVPKMFRICPRHDFINRCKSAFKVVNFGLYYYLLLLIN